jgi:hypothetical protein
MRGLDSSAVDHPNLGPVLEPPFLTHPSTEHLEGDVPRVPAKDEIEQVIQSEWRDDIEAAVVP